MMRGTTGLLAAAALLASGCEDRPAWPPYEAELTQAFEDNRETMATLRSEMVQDGLVRMSPTILEGSVLHADVTALGAERVAKYERLLADVPLHFSILRSNSGTEYEMISEAVGARLFLFKYVHSEGDTSIESCDTVSTSIACGSCAVDLDGAWSLEYHWSPLDFDVEARECRDLPR